ncbi:alpha/beta hydrolase [Pontiellaceae bacterium B1224]|nr:alpha/beta hydrolase [Pontiellaceae bacterium B1224]
MNKRDLKKILVGDVSFRRLIRSVVTIYLSLLVFAFLWSDRLIFQPHESSYIDDPSVIKLETSDGAPVSALYMPNDSAEYTVLYSHGNAEDLGDIRDFMTEYHARGLSMLSYDYPGYGTSPGQPTPANVYSAADAALKYLTEVKNVPLNRIIIHGRSVGGGPALYLAHENDVAGLIVESSFVSAFRTLTHIPLSPFDKFKNLKRIADVNCPVLVVHGNDDNTIPQWHGRKLYEKANEPKMNCWLTNTTHNYMPTEAEKIYWNRISSFCKLMVSENQ